MLVGGVVGIVVVFNILLVGVVFVIEELFGCFEYCFFGVLLMVVIVGGVVLFGLLGNYIYFGWVGVMLLLGIGWVVVLLCGVVGGLGGGLFSCLVLVVMDGWLCWFGCVCMVCLVLFVVGCGLLLVLFGLVFGVGVFGIGYE